MEGTCMCATCTCTHNSCMWIRCDWAHRFAIAQKCTVCWQHAGCETCRRCVWGIFWLCSSFNEWQNPLSYSHEWDPTRPVSLSIECYLPSSISPQHSLTFALSSYAVRIWYLKVTDDEVIANNVNSGVAMKCEHMQHTTSLPRHTWLLNMSPLWRRTIRRQLYWALRAGGRGALHWATDGVSCGRLLSGNGNTTLATVSITVRRVVQMFWNQGFSTCMHTIFIQYDQNYINYL